MSPQAIRREMRVITNVTRSSYKDHYQPTNSALMENNNNNLNNNQSPIDTDFELGHRGDTWDHRRSHLDHAEPDGISEVSASAANVANDGKHPLLEFAMRYFREGKFEGLTSDDGHPNNGSLKENKKKPKKKKSTAGDADWTWKDRVGLVKWTDRMITVSIFPVQKCITYTAASVLSDRPLRLQRYLVTLSNNCCLV